MAAAIAHHGAIKCAIDIALHDLAGKRAGAAGPRAARRCRPRSRRPTSRSGIDEPAVVAERAPRARPTSRRSRSRSAGQPTSRRSRRSARSTAARSAWTPTPAGRPDERRDLLPELRAARRRADRAAVPGPPARPAALAPGALAAADRRRRERRHHRGPRRARRGRRRRQREAREVRRHRSGAADARARPRARVPDVPRLHGGDVDRDRGVRRRRAAGRLGGPRRLPAPRRGPGRRASSSAPTSAGGWPSTRAGARPGRADGRNRPTVHTAGPADVHTVRAGCGQVGGRSWWKSPYRGPRLTAASDSAYRSGGTRAPGRRRPAPTHRSAAALVDQGRASSVPPRHTGEEDCRRCIPPARAPSAPSRPRPRPSCGSATSAGASGGPSCTTRCAAVAQRGLFRGMGSGAGGDRRGLQPVRDGRAGRDRHPGRGRGAGGSRQAGRRASRSGPPSRTAPSPTPTASCRWPWPPAPERAAAPVPRPIRTHHRRVMAEPGDPRPGRGSSIPGRIVARDQARIRRRAISPSIWRSAST